jgi:pyruvate dehydrogenase E2 component (dihydrolipoamide acetyltransferase)
MADMTFRLPDLGEGLTEAQLVQWRVKEGETVEVNAPLAEVETAKAVVVIPSPWAGTVHSLHGKPGQTIAVGSPLVTITTEAAPQGEAKAGNVLVGYGPDAGQTAGFRRRARAAAAAVEPTGDVRAAPFVRQLAKERGVDLNRVQGSGPQGRVTRADVEAAAGAGPPTAAPSEAPARGVAHDGDRASPDDQRISVVGIRKAIARQMMRSVSSIPQFTEFAIFDATALDAARARHRQEGRSLTPLPFFIQAVTRAVQQHPLLNSSWDDAADEIIVHRAMHVGIAVNTEHGLLVPVLKQADRMELDELASEAGRLIDGARRGSLPPAEMTGSTITITNVGASGPIETGTPIINPPECCVVGFGAIRLRPLVVDGQVLARPSAWISISVDHRIVDGGLATEFLTTLVELLEGING